MGYDLCRGRQRGAQTGSDLGSIQAIIWIALYANLMVGSLVGMAMLRDDLLVVPHDEADGFYTWYLVGLVGAMIPTLISLARRRNE